MFPVLVASVLNWTLLITNHGPIYVSILWCDLMVDDDYVLCGFCGFNIHAEYSWQKRAQQAWKYMLTNIERWRGEVWVHVVDKCKWLEVPSLSMSFQIISTSLHEFSGFSAVWILSTTARRRSARWGGAGCGGGWRGEVGSWKHRWGDALGYSW